MKSSTYKVHETKMALSILLPIVIGIAFGITGCKKLVEVDAPVTSINAANVYTSDATAAAVLTGIYTKISDQNYDLSFIDNINGISLFPSLSADELTVYHLSNTSLRP